MKHATAHALSALNIVVHPHSTKGYVSMFESAMKRKQHPVRVRGDQFGIVASCFRIKPSDEESPLEGEMFRFTEIELGEEWFNILRLDVANEEELKQISIPSHLRPNLKRFRYLFFPLPHRLVFETRHSSDSLPSPAAKRIVENFLSHGRDTSVSVTVEQSQEALEKMLRIDLLQYLAINVHQPNDDEGSLSERAIIEEMKKQNILSEYTELRAEPGKSIKPNRRTQILAQAATSNGNVAVSGRDERGRKINEDTALHPLVEHRQKPGNQDLVGWFRNAAEEVVKKILEK